MYKFLSFMLLVAALVGCSREDGQKLPESNTPAKRMDAAPIALSAASEFPPGFTPAFSYRIRSKKLDIQGSDRYRKLVIEYKEGDVNSVDKSIEGSLSGIGFRRYKNFQQPNGTIVGDYGNAGRRVTVTTTPKQPDMNLLDPGSLGTVYFVWKE